MSAHNHGLDDRTTHVHAYGYLKHHHLLRAVCDKEACKDFPTHNIHAGPRTDYDEYPDHPLCGVLPTVLESARVVTRQAAETGDITEDLIEPLADAVVLQLRVDGHIQ